LKCRSTRGLLQVILRRVHRKTENLRVQCARKRYSRLSSESSRPATLRSPSPPPQDTRRGRLASPSLLLLFKSCQRWGRSGEPFPLSRFRNQTPRVLPPVSLQPPARRATVCHCQVHKLPLLSLGIFFSAGARVQDSGAPVLGSRHV
jgi:hypothetical protein